MLPPLSSKLCGDRPGVFKGLFDLNSKEFKHAPRGGARAGAGRPPGRKGPMLKEEQFHLGTGHNGLKRILRAGKIPVTIIQKYCNKWTESGLHSREKEIDAVEATEARTGGR